MICQIESLHHLLPEFEFVGGVVDIPSYDLIVIDEVESVLNHFRSSTIKNKQDTFNLMKNLVFNANKVLALDGDFSNRSYCFLEHFGKCNVLHNEIKKDIRHFIFVTALMMFELNIENTLLGGKNAVIVTMSSELALYFSKKYEGRYKTVLHTAKSDDENKNNLKNVTEFWIQYELVIYSPCVESGVSFDVPHFDKIYVVLSAQSTSPRGLMQMINRVRKLGDPNIMVYLNGLPYKETSNFYSYDEIEEYICDTYNSHVKASVVMNPETKKMQVVHDFDLYAKVLVYNELENANKTKNLFVPYFIKLLTEKGHTYEYLEPTKRKINKVENLTKSEIFKIADIDANELDELLIKQYNSEATREDKLKIERYMLIKNWKLNEITEEFLDKFYGKTNVLFNLRFLLDKTLIKTNTIDYDEVKKLEQIQMIDEIICGLGYEKIGDGKKLDKEVFQENIKKVMTECVLFTNPVKSQPLFAYDKNKVGAVNTIKQFMGFVNSLFSDWGICLRICKNNKRINNKHITLYLYTLDYIDNIDNYI